MTTNSAGNRSVASDDLRACGPRKVSISPYLQLVRRNDGCFTGYHSLFGNVSVLDEELANSIEDLRHQPLTLQRCVDALGQPITSELWDAYYLSEPDEERAIVNTWLMERSAQLSSGKYLGGLQISSSNACNFTCAYCFADASDRRSSQRQLGTELPNISLQTACLAIDNVLNTARSHGRDRIGVKFLGREPLINYRVIRQLMDRYPRASVAWSITTNGSLVTPEIAQQLAEADAKVVVSIDGLPQVNDRQRMPKSRRNQSAYSLAIKGLETLTAAGVVTSVSSVVSSNTDFALMPEFFDRLKGLGCREVELTLAMQTDALKLQAKYADTSIMVERLVALYAEACSRGLFVSGDWIDPYHAIFSNHKYREEAQVARPRGAGCQATEHQISVEPNGDLFPCRAMSLHYGNLSNWHAVLDSPAYRSVAMRTFYAVPYCNGCMLEGHCQGTCLGSLEEASNDIYSPQEEYCAIYRKVVWELIRLNLERFE